MRKRVTTFVIFGVSAIATGWQQLYTLMWAIWGAPTSLIQYIGLAGSAILGVASIVVFVHERGAYLMSVLAVLLIWSFYGPALWVTMRQLFAQPGLLSSDPWVFVPLLLLIASTVFLASARKQSRLVP